MDFYDEFIVKPGKKINLAKISPDEKDYGWQGTKEEIAARLEENGKKLFKLQYRLYAENCQSLLIVLQALDAGGKDGTINKVLSVMNPQGCRSQAFKVPTALEAAHDFIWREHCVAPRDGEVVIFNRSHYENVLVPCVHGELKGEELKERLKLINDFEKLLGSNRTAIVKFFLHISKDEQLKRFGERLNDPEKHWKISESDYREREFWDDYMKAFNQVISNCSTKDAPWFVIPANNKDFRNLAVSEILIKTLETMNPAIPAPTVNIEEIRKLYHQDLGPVSAPQADPDESGKKAKKDKKDKKKKSKK